MHSHSDARHPRQVLRRLVGPSGPELTCQECFERLDEYVELEHSNRPADDVIPGMRSHLEGCLACSEEHDSLLALLDSER